MAGGLSVRSLADQIGDSVAGIKMLTFLFIPISGFLVSRTAPPLLIIKMKYEENAKRKNKHDVFI